MPDASDLEAVMRYHERTKHHFNRYAAGPGELDWANQPDPFLRYAGAVLTRLPVLGPEEEPVSPAYESLYARGADLHVRGAPTARRRCLRGGIDDAIQCRYSNYMKRDPLPTPPKSPAKVELKVVRIGNSRGVRLPKAVLERYEIKDALVLEAREDGLLLRGKKDKRLTWEETYREAARAKEDWSDFDATLADGIEPGEKW